MRENGQDGQQKQDEDEEGEVDSKIKQKIIEARDRVDRTKEAVDVKAELEPDIQLSPDKKTELFAKTVKQFLIRIEPLLTADEIKDNRQYYVGTADNPIAKFHLYPPDTDGYRFSLIERVDDAEGLRRQLELPPEADIPQPHPVVLQGLRDIIETPLVVSHQWEVVTACEGAPPNWDYVYPTRQQIIPQTVWLDAVREADTFLQSIGIGVQTGLPEVDEKGQPF